MSNSTDSSNASFDKEKASQDSSASRSTAERISFWIALAILAGLIGSVGYLWMSNRNQAPPTLQLSTESTEQRQNNYYVPFTVTNTGGQTAGTVQVIAELRVNGEIVEWGEQTVEFLSRKEEATGAFVFVQDPNQGELTVRAASYLMP